MNSNRKHLIAIGLITLFVTRIILGFIKVNSISIVIIVLLLITASIMYSFDMIRNREKNKTGVNFNIISSVLMLIFSFSISESMILLECFPKFSDEHMVFTLVSVAIALISFFSFIIYAVIASIKMAKKN